MKRDFAITALIVLVSGSAIPAQGNVIAVSWGGSSTLINSTTGVATPLGPSGAVNLNAMAGDPTTSVIYAIGGTGTLGFLGPGAVYTINPVTGAATNTGVLLAVNDVRGIAITPSGTCYALVAGAPDKIYTVNLATGAAVFIGVTGLAQGTALASDANGTLYSWNGGFGGLCTINQTTGIASQIGGALIGIQSLAFSPSGILYGVQNALYTINTTTGAPTQVGAGGYGDVRGLEFVPVPYVPGTVTFSPLNGQVTPGGTLAVHYTAPLHSNQVFIPVVSFGLGSTAIPGLPQPLPIVWDACTDFYFTHPAGIVLMPLSGVPGSFLGVLDGSGFSTGYVLPPLGAIPPGLNLPVHVTYVTSVPLGFQVQGVGTFILN